jgi:hypothetical protein
MMTKKSPQKRAPGSNQTARPVSFKPAPPAYSEAGGKGAQGQDRPCPPGQVANGDPS